MKLVSDDLKQFLTEWNHWAKQGAITTKFNRSWGLCSNLEDWCDSNDKTEQEFYNLYDELREAYSEYTDHSGYFPFGGCDLYFEEFENRTAHLNWQRLAFVKEILEENSK